LWQVVMAVGRRATQCDEYRSRPDRACIYADAANAVADRDGRSGADESTTGSLDNFGERERALIAGNRRRHREYIVPNYPGRSYRLRLDMPAGWNQPQIRIMLRPSPQHEIITIKGTHEELRWRIARHRWSA